MGTQGESQWAAARELLSTLTTPGVIYVSWGNRNRMLRKVFRLGRHFGFFLPIGVVAIPRFLRNSVGWNAKYVHARR